MKKAILASVFALALTSSVGVAQASILPEAAFWEDEGWGARSNESYSSAEYHSSSDYQVYGHLVGSTDDDCFIIVGNGTSATVNVSMAQDIELTIYDDTGTRITSTPIDRVGEGGTETWTGTIPNGAEYVVKITPYDNGSGFKASLEDFPYMLDYRD